MRAYEAVAGFGLSLAVGVGLGAAVENHTNEIAEGKIITAETCRDLENEQQDTISKKMVECMEDGVPGGQKIGGDNFDEGDPIEFVDSYIDAQEHEAAQIELGRLVVWSIVPDAIAVAWIGTGLS
ncbi:MAG TPA: hypothetical protein VK694_03260 [Verrucomicrobiae bacterium]|nr:hypothetical protein [Verrucomicrobiae bacterium]